MDLYGALRVRGYASPASQRERATIPAAAIRLAASQRQSKPPRAYAKALGCAKPLGRALAPPQGPGLLA